MNNSTVLAARSAMHGVRRSDRDVTDLRTPPMLLEPLRPPSAEDIAAARQQIQARATDAPEAQRLMAMLGIA